MGSNKMGVKIAYKIALVLGVIGVLDSLWLLSFGLGLNFGVLLPGVLGAGLIAAWLFYNRWGLDVAGLEQVRFRRLWLGLFGLLLCSCLALEGMILTAAQPEEDQPVDYMIVLGAALHDKQMSLTLNSRMETALGYLRSHPQVKVVLSGGQGRGETITEAAAMEEYLLRHQVSPSRIIKEEASTSTLENLRFSQRLIRKAGASPRVIIVTNDFHLFRAKLLAKRIGLVAYGLPAPTPWSVLINAHLREYFAIIKSYFLD
ncbi:MAG TPA: YdcF family protein [Bacillota bacterium]|nr:YdcF family protein [Bacillota bacterium]